jgi:dipeptidyl aminopeptidase/acylaminoacyl peptidase
MEDVAISPDGKSLAFVINSLGKRTVVVKSIDDRKTIAAIAAGDQKLRGLSWADSTHLLITASTTRTANGTIGMRREFFMSQSFDLASHKFLTLLDGLVDVMNVVAEIPETRLVDGHTYLFVRGGSRRDDRIVPTLFSVNLDAGETKIVYKGTRNTDDWLIDPNGRIVAWTEYDNDARQWSLGMLRGGSEKPIYRVDADIETPQAYAFGPDGTTIVIREVDNGQIGFKQLRISDGTIAPATELGSGFTSTIEDPLTNRVIGTVAVGGHTEYRFIARSDEEAWAGVVEAFAGEELSLMSWSTDRSRIVVRVDGQRDGSAYELVDNVTHLAIPIGPAYRGIDSSDVAAVKFVTYKASDGRDIPAYLTVPNGRPAKNLPLVVLPHGGPALRDDPGFDWWSQALASRGYAVLQPEFRGSDGFGWEFLSAGFGQWGRKMQTDLSDGVRSLAAQGLIDPKRVCIVGASYGGYAALAGATLDRGVYRCAVSYAGVSDPHSFMRFIKNRDNLHDEPVLRYWSRFMGAENLDDPKLAEISPVVHATDSAIPVLLIHGKDDTVVPIEQSEQMESALKAAGKPVNFIQLDGEDHWLSRSETRLQMLQATVAFLEANNPPN